MSEDVRPAVFDDVYQLCRYATHVHEALTGLVADSDQEVRRLMAGHFHDICKMLGKERCAQYMKRYTWLLPDLLLHGILLCCLHLASQWG